MTSTEQEHTTRVDRREEVEGALFRGGADNYDVAVDLLLPLIARFEREAAAKALREMADAVRSTEVLFRREDGSGVKYGDLLRDRAAALTDVDGVQS